MEVAGDEQLAEVGAAALVAEHPAQGGRNLRNLLTIIPAGSGTRAEDRYHAGFATAQQSAGTRQVRLYHYGCSVIVGFDGLAGVDAGTGEMLHIAVLLIQKDAVALGGSAVEK